MKKCRTCEEIKPIGDFLANHRMADGFNHECKACASARNRAWQKENREKCKEKSQKWREKNRDRVNEKAKIYYGANKEKCRELNSAWQKNNPEYCRIRVHNRRSKENLNGEKLSKGLTQRLFKSQRGLCPCCGLALGDDYHLDHIMPIALGGKNEDNNIQLLRAICNLRKNAKHPITYMQGCGFLL